MSCYLFANFNYSLNLSPSTSPISYHDNLISTLGGKVKPSDVQLVHRYKWSAKEYESMYKTLKEQNKTQDQYLFDLQSQLLDIIWGLAIKTGS